MKLFALEKIKPGFVAVAEDGVVVAQGLLSTLIRDDGPEADNTEMFVNPADVAEAKARFFTGRLN